MFHDSKDPLTVHTLHLSNHDLKDAQRLLSILARALDEDSNRTAGAREAGADVAGLPTSGSDRLRLRARAAELMRLSQKRSKFFPRAMFGEPPWDMLITLYVSDSRFSIGRLGDHTGIATTSAVRWINYLEKENLVSRESHPTDMRRVLIEITDRARNLLDMYFSETLTSET